MLDVLNAAYPVKPVREDFPQIAVYVPSDFSKTLPQIFVLLAVQQGITEILRPEFVRVAQ